LYQENKKFLIWIRKALILDPEWGMPVLVRI
jgi:hypothetical protein